MAEQTPVEELRRLLETATPRPWLAERDDDAWAWDVWLGPERGGIIANVIASISDGTTGGDNGEANCRLIVAAVNALPSLLDELERPRRVIDLLDSSAHCVAREARLRRVEEAGQEMAKAIGVLESSTGDGAFSLCFEARDLFRAALTEESRE